MKPQRQSSPNLRGKQRSHHAHTSASTEHPRGTRKPPRAEGKGHNPNSHAHHGRNHRRKRRPLNETAPLFKPFTPEQLAARAAAIPVISFPDLPVTAHKDQIAQAIRDNQVVIVAGETGSGKTTQLPKILLQLGRGVEGMIGHTQPRRIAAHAVASRIAEELGQSVGKNPGQVVGYQVRFTDQVGPTTLIKLMTDGILLAEIQSDPLLRRYDTLIIDEAHERSLNIDFILGYLARLLPMRPDLKVIITSATIDSARFAQHFGRWEESGHPVPAGQGTLISPVPVIEVSGRTYPVEIRYRPLSADLPTQWSSSTPNGTAHETQATDTSSSEENQARSAHFQQLMLEDPDDDLPTLGYGLGEDIDQETAICHAVDELCAEGEGDILVFLPGERDIRDVQQALIDHLGPRAITDKSPARKSLLPGSIEIIPLYARLTAAEQQRIFQPHTLRRVVLSTNVAETSLTVPGIRYVIDPGLARISRYSNRTKVQRLPIEAISQASANQRAGRSGRLEDGVTIRLYSQRDYENRPAFTEPEILRTSLASVILQMAALGLGAVESFPFLDRPDSRAVRDGVQLLVEIGALEYVDDTGASPKTKIATRLTAIGRDLARLPIDPRLGRILLEADANGAASDVLIIVAALSLQDVRERPLDHQGAADEAHARFTDPHSDFITYLNLWRYLTVQQRDLSGTQFRKMCRSEFLHYLRWREWRDIVTQLTQLAKPLDLNIHPIGEPSPSDVIHAAETGGLHNAAARAVVAYTASHRTVSADQIHRSLLVGLLSNLGSWDKVKRDYQGARGTHFTIWPGSGLARSHPAWVMTAELVETSRLFARTVARIEPEWVEPLAKSLVKRVYSEPYWSSSKGAAMVKEKVLLYGLTLSADRPVLLGRVDTVFGEGASRKSSVARPGTLLGIAQGLQAAEPRFDVRISGIDRLAEAGLVSSASAAASGFMGATANEDPAGEAALSSDPENTNAQAISADDSISNATVSHSDNGISARELAREMFIRHALVRGEWREVHRFQKLNDDLLEQAREVERRSRTHGLVADEDARFAFFDDLIPPSVISARHFNQWWKMERRDHPNLLTYPMSLLLPRGTGEDATHFPDMWVIDDGYGRPAQDTTSLTAHADRIELPLSYHFNPGSQRDGVTVSIPVELLERVTDAGCDWLVPGLRDDLLTEFIRALPKAKRRLLAPAPEVANTIARWIDNPTPVSSASSTPTGNATTNTADEVDPMSLEAAMGRLAAWGAQTGKARSAKNRPAPAEHKPFAQKTQDTNTSTPVQIGDTHAEHRTLAQTVADAVRTLRGVDLSDEDLAHASQNLPAHLRMTFVVCDRNGRELGESKSLAYLQRTLANQADTAIRQAVRGAVAEALDAARQDATRRKGTKLRKGQMGDLAPLAASATTTPDINRLEQPVALHQDNLTSFPTTPIPRSVDSVGAGGMALRGYPCLVSQGSIAAPAAGIRVMANPSSADRQHRDGVAALLELRLNLSTARVTTRWTGRQAAMLAASPYVSTAELVADAQMASALTLVDELAVNGDASTIRDTAAFEELAVRARNLHEDRVYDILGHVIRALEAYAEAQGAVSECAGVASLTMAVRDAKRQMKALVYPSFIAQTPAYALPHLARYLRGIALRLRKAASGGLNRDAENMTVVRDLEAMLEDTREAADALPFNAARDQQITSARWMIEELRVSLFAQTLGTPQKVSAKRIRAALAS